MSMKGNDVPKDIFIQPIEKPEVSSGDILHAVHFQRRILITQNPEAHKTMCVYLGSHELNTLLNDDPYRFSGLDKSREHWKLLGMPVYEVVIDQPHVRVAI